MLTRANRSQTLTLRRLVYLWKDAGVFFTLIGGAACREYGLTRTANDLDFTVAPYNKALQLVAASGQFEPVLDSPDPTGRTCTQLDLETNLNVDLLTGGIYINDGTCRILGGFYKDQLPVPMPTGSGDIASLPTLIAIKTSAAISGLETLKLGANTGGRNRLAIEKDLADVKELISLNKLPRDLSLGSRLVEEKYRELYDSLRR